MVTEAWQAALLPGSSSPPPFELTDDPYRWGSLQGARPGWSATGIVHPAKRTVAQGLVKTHRGLDLPLGVMGEVVGLVPDPLLCHPCLWKGQSPGCQETLY